MAAKTLGTLTKTGLGILSTVLDATGLILAQLGDIATEQVESDDAEWWQHVGFASRPSKATAKHKSAQAIAIKTGHRDAIIASRDKRGATIIGALDHGETALYAEGPDGTSQARVLLKGDSSITLYTQNGSGGTSVALQVRADGTFKVFGPLGAITLDSSGLTLLAGSSGIVMGADGTMTISCKSLQINGKNCAMNVGSAQIGQAACAVASLVPNPAFTAIRGPSGLAGTPSGSVTIG